MGVVDNLQEIRRQAVVVQRSLVRDLSIIEVRRSDLEAKNDRQSVTIGGGPISFTSEWGKSLGKVIDRRRAVLNLQVEIDALIKNVDNYLLKGHDLESNPNLKVMVGRWSQQIAEVHKTYKPITS